MTVGKDVSTCFYLAMATRTLGALCREKVLSKLPNGSMIKNGSSRPSTQDDQLANERKPAPTFSIGGLEKVLDTTFEREEVTTLRGRTSKECSLCIKIGSSILRLKSVKRSSWIASSSNLGTGSIFMCQKVKRPLGLAWAVQEVKRPLGLAWAVQEVKRPLGLAWAVPEVNRAIRVIGEEAPKGLDNGKRVGLA